MRVLWLCNIMLPAFAEANGLPYSNREGWLSGLFDRLTGRQGAAEQDGAGRQEAAAGQNGAAARQDSDAAERQDRAETARASSSVTLGVCFPASEAFCGGRREIDGVAFYGFAEDLNTPERYKPELEEKLAAIVRDFAPDLVHIFGTEFPHALAMARAFGKPERTLIGIQGLCGSIAEVYMEGLPYKVQRAVTFRDWYRQDSLRRQQQKYRQRAVNEREALRLANHITGRTHFDREAAEMIHPEALYHPMNETMRAPFYSGRWRLGAAEPYSIFLSQGDYPIKGFHYMLQAMPSILEHFPQAQLCVAGNSIVGNIGGRIPRKKYPTPVWITAYGRYLRSLIRRNGLQGHVTMLGKLSAEQMKEQFLRSHVFVCPSTIENSPNALGEAMLLGMPVVAAKVGGIPDFVEDGEEGILFPGGRYEELALAVQTVFRDNETAVRLGENARARARLTHSPDTNYMRLLEIYRSMAEA